MFSIIIATHDSERELAATLCALVPGATMGVVREVIVADGGSRDETEEIADIAGCRFVASAGPLGIRLKAAAVTARGTWLMFLSAGVMPAPGWIDETGAFIEDTGRRERPCAAVFAPENALAALLRRLPACLPAPRQGLIIGKSFYDALGGHRDTANAEADLLRRIGRRRLAALRTAATQTYI